MSAEASPPPWLAPSPPRFIFFTGKGGVGKTSLSCATALLLADGGARVLLVSTDPASNLDQVLAVSLGPEPTPVPGCSRLSALNVDPRGAAARYRERVVAPYRGVLPDEAVAGIEEQLSGACTVEIAAFDQFSRLMTGEAGNWDHVVFDTAPTGHTLRLLQLPSAWKGYIDAAGGSTSCLGPMSGLTGHREQFAATLETLVDPSLTRLVLVARADVHSLAEAARTSRELSSLGLANKHLVVNGVLSVSPDGTDATARAWGRRQEAALSAIPDDLGDTPCSRVPLSSHPPVGLPNLRRLLSPPEVAGAPPLAAACVDPDPGSDLDALVRLVGTEPGLILTMGKGGVGKTTIATRIAIALARQGARVHLTTSDPAAALDTSLGQRVPGLRVSVIDPRVEAERYRAEVMATTGLTMDDEGRRLLDEDLRSPCTEEVAVFRAFARVVDEARHEVVVLDTAPTGHTILLLDATQSYHRDVARQGTAVPDEVRLLLPRLRDPSFTRVMIVALPEATPVQEALELEDDLARAGITPFAWVLNACLTPLTVTHPVLAARRDAEAPHLRLVEARSPRLILVPWLERPLPHREETLP